MESMPEMAIPGLGNLWTNLDRDSRHRPHGLARDDLSCHQRGTFRGGRFALQYGEIPATGRTGLPSHPPREPSRTTERDRTPPLDPEQPRLFLGHPPRV